MKKKLISLLCVMSILMGIFANGGFAKAATIAADSMAVGRESIVDIDEPIDKSADPIDIGKEPIDINEDPISADGDKYIDGVNQSYLDYKKITKDEFVAQIANGEFNEDGALIPQLKSSSTGFLDFSNIIKNPGDYFKIIPFFSEGSMNLKVGLNYEKLNDTLKYINYPIKETTYNRYYIRNVKLKSVSTNSLLLSAEIQVKKYTKKPWPLRGIWCILNTTGNCDIKINYTIDSSDNSITFKKVNASNVSVDRSIFNYILAPGINLVVDYILKNISVNQSIDQKIVLDFLPRKYVSLSSMYTENAFLYMNFKLIVPDQLQTVLNLAKSKNIPVLGNTTDVDEVPVMTGNTSPYGIASASSVYSSSYEAWRAFDGNDQSDIWSRWISNPGSLPAWLCYQFPTEKRITRYFVLPEYSSSNKDRSPKDWVLQGWNGSSWISLDSRSNITLDNVWNASGLYFNVQNPGYYTKYRLYITALNGSDAVSIRQFKLFQ